jgi:hypothetical protein
MNPLLLDTALGLLAAGLDAVSLLQQEAAGVPITDAQLDALKARRVNALAKLVAITKSAG